MWRLAGMVLLVVLLIIALLPTGNYGTGIGAADYAICSFKHLRPIQRNATETTDVRLNYASMVLSILLLGVSFMSRIVRLHKVLSVTLFSTCRRYLSRRARKQLRGMYTHCEQTGDRTLKRNKPRVRLLFRLFYYRPALAVFLAMRAVLDVWSSLALEVS